MSEKLWNNTMEGTPIARLFELGYSDLQIGNITSLTVSAVNKWRNGSNKANMVPQNAARAYLDSLDRFDKEKEMKTVTSVVKSSIGKTPMYLVTVPVESLKRFTTMMDMIGVTFVDLDD